MTFFSTFLEVASQPTDELLLVRDGAPKKTAVGNLPKAIFFSENPPDTGYLWGQLDGEGALMEIWQRREALWLSDVLYPIAAYRGSVSGSTTRYPSVPVLGERVWVEDMSVQGLNQVAMTTADRYDFQLRTVDTSYRQTPRFFLRLEGATQNQAFRLSESVGLVVDADAALTMAFRAQRTGNRARLRLITMSARLRRVYHASDS